MSWKDRINDAVKSGEFTEKDREEAAEWKTCAVGERTWYYLESDAKPLGIEFNDAVQSGDIEAATDILKKIDEKNSEDENYASC